MKALVFPAVCLLVVALANTACAANSQSIDRLEQEVVFDTSDAGVTRDVGTVGTKDFKIGQHYLFLMRPALTADGKVSIPSNKRSAVNSLKSALPAHLLQQLHFEVGPGEVCVTGDTTLDVLIRKWMIHYWQLRSDNKPTKEYGGGGHLQPQAIAEKLLLELCRLLPMSRG